METFPTAATDAVNQIIEVIDYTPYLQSIDSRVVQIADASVLITGFLLFFVVVALCYFVYKFFRIFF